MLLSIGNTTRIKEIPKERQYEIEDQGIISSESLRLRAASEHEL
jgi:hypothetical protein